MNKKGRELIPTLPTKILSNTFKYFQILSCIFVSPQQAAKIQKYLGNEQKEQINY